jgi:hypothetical protein
MHVWSADDAIDKLQRKKKEEGKQEKERKSTHLTGKQRIWNNDWKLLSIQ